MDTERFSFVSLIPLDRFLVACTALAVSQVDMKFNGLNKEEACTNAACVLHYPFVSYRWAHCSAKTDLHPCLTVTRCYDSSRYPKSAEKRMARYDLLHE